MPTFYKRRFFTGLGLIAALGAGANAASAEPSAGDKALATALFQQGRSLLDEGKVPEACRKLEESQRLDPGGGTLLNLALCHEKEGKSATAWTELTEALGMAKRDGRRDRQDIAEQHIGALEKTLSRLVISVPTDVDLPDLEVKRDGTAVGRAAWGTPMPTDPGDHVIEASAPGKLPRRQTVALAGGGNVKSISIAKLEDAPKAALPIDTTTAGGGASVGASFGAGTPDRGPEGASTKRMLGFMTLGLGIGGLGAGGYFLAHALAKKSDANNACGPGGSSDPCQTQGGADDSREAARSADFATIGLGIGAAGVVVGVFLLATSSSGSHHVASSSSPASSLRVEPIVGRGTSAISLTGSF